MPAGPHTTWAAWGRRFTWCDAASEDVRASYGKSRRAAVSLRAERWRPSLRSRRRGDRFLDIGRRRGLRLGRVPRAFGSPGEIRSVAIARGPGLFTRVDALSTRGRKQGGGSRPRDLCYVLWSRGLRGTGRLACFRRLARREEARREAEGQACRQEGRLLVQRHPEEARLKTQASGSCAPGSGHQAHLQGSHLHRHTRLTPSVRRSIYQGATPAGRGTRIGW